MSEETEQQLMRAWHDLGAPLRAIRLLVDLTETGSEPLGPETRQNLAMMTGRAKRAERLIDQLLDFMLLKVRPEAREAVDTREVLELALEQQAESGFSFEVSGQWPQAQLPPKYFAAALTELLTNAIKHSGDGASHDARRVVVEASPQASQLEIRVRDHGKGIDPRFHDTVFEFCKTLQSQDQIEGSGMGLTLIREALVHYGGQISLDSEVGKGTTVSMIWALPRQDSPDA